MHTRSWQRALGVMTVGVCVVGVLSSGVLAQSGMMGERDVIAERQELMKNTGGNFKDLSQKAKEGQFARIAVNAHTIAINARHIPILFPKGSMGTAEQKSRAKAEIWQDWEGFTAAAKKAQEAAMDLMNLTKDADKMAVTAEQVAASREALLDACKACHKKFRVPKKN
jgi:cytochrome c556